MTDPAAAGLPAFDIVQLGAGTWPILLATLLKGALLLAVGALCAWGLQRLRASASARHLTWTLVLLGALALPLVATVGPSWEPRVAVPGALLPVSPGASPQATGEPRARAGAAPSSAEENVSITSGGNAASGASSETARLKQRLFEGWPWAAGLAFLWLAGLAVALGRLALGTLRAWQLARRSERLTEKETAFLSNVREALPAWRRVRVCFAEGLATPITWGVFRPLIVLPKEAVTEWSLERRRAALLHELAHVRRFDPLTQALAEIACAVHWPNPLAWHAARRMRFERERACDDRALAGPEAPTPAAYAEGLLETARAVRHQRLPGAGGAVAMASASPVEERIKAALNESAERGAVGRPLVALCAAAAVGFVTLTGAFHPRLGNGGTADANAPGAKAQRAPAVQGSVGAAGSAPATSSPPSASTDSGSGQTPGRAGVPDSSSQRLRPQQQQARDSLRFQNSEVRRTGRTGEGTALDGKWQSDQSRTVADRKVPAIAVLDLDATEKEESINGELTVTVRVSEVFSVDEDMVKRLRVKGQHGSPNATLKSYENGEPASEYQARASADGETLLLMNEENGELTKYTKIK